jgi:chromate transporter
VDPQAAAQPAHPARPARAREVARIFLRLGVLGFGGPAAHIALMRTELVQRRRWVSDQEFLDLVGATNLIPGPNSTELAIHLGARRGGRTGFWAAGIAFIAPAVLIVAVLAWAYEHHGTTAAVVDLRYGILPIVVAIIAHAGVGLAATACRTDLHVVIAGAAGGAWLAGVHELVLLALAGLATALPHLARRVPRTLVIVPVAGAAVLHGIGDRVRLFLVFLRIGAVLYGSGYVLVSFLERDLVRGLGWLTPTELLDAVAVGQITPGPVFTTATFVGWQLDGPLGAAIATFAIFAPSFVFVALLRRVVPWIRATPWASAALDGVNAATVGLLFAVVVRLANDALDDWFTVAIALVSLAALAGRRLGPTVLIAVGAAIGALRLLV